MRRQWLAVAALLACLGWGRPLTAGTAALVADLDPTAGAGGDEDVQAMQPFGSGVLLLTGELDVVLWVSDGTVEGTVPIHNVCPDVCGPPSFLGTVGRLALFQAGQHLWATDGTAAGTRALGVDLAPSQANQPLAAATPRALFFFACAEQAPPDAACSLMKSDGTADGTVVLRGGFPAVSGVTTVRNMVPVGDRVFFDEKAGGQLWTSDGTPTGTLPVGRFTLALSAPAIAYYFAATPSRLFFFGGDADSNIQIYSSDGTPGGTVQLTRFPSTAKPDASFSPQAVGDDYYFVFDDGAHGPQLYRSDGSRAGTRAVTAFATADPFGPDNPIPLASAGSIPLFVAANGSQGPSLWAIGTNAAAADPLTGCPGGCPVVPFGTSLYQVGSRVVFQLRDDPTGSSLWSTDGTGAGTLRLSVCRLCDPSLFFPVGERALFHWQAGGQTGTWITDGTPAGTHFLLSNYLQPELDPLAVGERLFLVLEDGTHPPHAAQLWVGDGTAAGQRQLTQLGDDGGSSSPGAIVPYGGGVLFSATLDRQAGLWALGVHGAGGTVPQLLRSGVQLPATSVPLNGFLYFLSNQLWRTDGTAAGTLPLTAFPEGVGELVAVGDRLFYSALTLVGSQYSMTLYSGDGTAAGSAAVAGVPACGALGSLTPAGSRLYFAASCGSDGSYALWVTDGTAGGTRQLTTVPATYLDFRSLAAVGNTLYFTIGGQLWRSDGSAAGTLAVLPGADQASALGSNAQYLTPFAGSVLFFAATGEGTQRGLFRSDGTAAGTLLLQPIAPPLQVPPSFTPPPGVAGAAGTSLFAAGDAAHGTELWRTDGTPAGTVLVRDIAGGGESSNPSSLVAAGGVVYFAANDGVHGDELWRSDGTATGTYLVQDIYPGARSASPAALAVAGGQLYFAADDGIHGDELWSYLLDGAAGCQPSPLALCLGGRFTVQARWQIPAFDSFGDPTADATGDGQAVALSSDTGYFWFFDPNNVEVVLKTLDGRGLNGHFWTFYGALSNVAYELTETDTWTGATRRYVNPPGLLASVADTAAFGSADTPGAGGVTRGPAGQPGVAQREERNAAPQAAGCVPGPVRLCLAGGRFAVTATWRDFAGNSGRGSVVKVTDDTGYFWFFSSANVEVMLKVLDGQAANGKFWVFYGALSDVEYTLTVTDTVTGAVRTYTNPAGNLASIADTSAF